jgi:hypothetical protein
LSEVGAVKADTCNGNRLYLVRRRCGSARVQGELEASDFGGNFGKNAEGSRCVWWSSIAEGTPIPSMFCTPAYLEASGIVIALLA